MPTYPGGIYVRPDPIPSLRSTAPTLSTILGQFGDEIEAIEATLGINSQGGSATVDARLDLIEGAWATYTPTLAGATWVVGNGTIAGRYLRLGVAGKTILFGARVTFGSTSTYGAGQPTLSLPVAALNDVASGVGSRSGITSRVRDASAPQDYYGPVEITTTTTISPFVFFVSAATVGNVGITSTVPMTFTTSDYIEVFGQYEAA